MKSFRRSWAVAALLVAGGGQSAAQAPEDLAALPALAAPEKELGDPRKFFLFHKPGVTAQQAEADLGFCWRFLEMGQPRRLPSFVPWRQTPSTQPISYDGGQFGLTGAVVGAMIAGPLERSRRQSRMFRCMVPRGYHRYRTTEAVWKRLNSGDPAGSIRLQAQIAAGPVPPTPRILP